VGDREGRYEGLFVGTREGDPVGATEGVVVGRNEGRCEGSAVVGKAV
jgi:hypothetical protein